MRARVPILKSGGAALHRPMTLAIVAALLLVLLGVLMARYEDWLDRQQSVANLQAQSRLLSQSLAPAVAAHDAAAALGILAVLKNDPQLEGAAAYAGRQRLASIGGFMPAAVSLASSNQFQITEAVRRDGAVIGWVSLRAAAPPAMRRIAIYAGLLLLVSMGALVIFVLSVLQTRLARRARHLSDVNLRLADELKERARSEEALRQGQKMEAIGQLSGGIAHEFNNLMMIVKSNLRLLRRRLEPQGETRYLDAADLALDRAAGLTQRILAFSRRQPLSPQSIDLNLLLEGMSDLLRHSVGKTIAIETDLKAHWPVLCDANQMENVILNLAINARDAMPEGGRLRIQTRDVTLAAAPPDVSDFAAGPYVLLAVSDTGGGMSDAVRRRALEPFFTTKPQGEGTGLGLSMSFGFVRQSGGYLSIDSEPGHGTTILIYLPRLVSPAAASRPARAAATH